MSSTKPYHHGALKAALLSRAMEDIEVVGLEGLSLRRLAERSGVSKTAPYRHFKDKRDLLVHLAAEGFGMLADALEAGGAAGAAPLAANAGPVPEADPTAALRALLRAYVDFARARPALYKLMISRLGYELHSEECRRNSERALGSLFRAVGEAQRLGWRAGQDGEALGLSLWASAHGWASLLIDELLPQETAAQGADWLQLARALLA